MRQADICAEIVALAQAGETVVRLKGGDPRIFGRATEEIDACRAAGIPVSIVPGITAAQGAAASLGISLTERVHARRVQFVTGHGADGELPGDIDWGAIADRAGDDRALHAAQDARPISRARRSPPGSTRLPRRSRSPASTRPISAMSTAPIATLPPTRAACPPARR